MGPVRIPQHLELEDLLIWRLGAADLAFVGSGALVAWWMYLSIPGAIGVRLCLVAPVLAITCLLGMARCDGSSVRSWLVLVLGYLARPRLRVYRGGIE